MKNINFEIQTHFECIFIHYSYNIDLSPKRLSTAHLTNNTLLEIYEMEEEMEIEEIRINVRFKKYFQ